MFEIVPGIGWMAFAYLVGTLFGLWVKQTHTVAFTIDSLVERGYLKSRKMPNGDIEILKYNED